MKWDCTIGSLSFLFGTNQQTQYRRETAEFRRQRIDQERDVGEQSLDSGYWLRSQSSFHLGAGLQSSEPVTVSPDEARFRFRTSQNMDVWTPGELKLLKNHVLNYATTTTPTTSAGCLGLGESVLMWHDGVIRRATESTPGVFANSSVTNPFTATGPVTSATTDGSVSIVTGTTQIAKGNLSPTTLSLIYNAGTAISFARFLKQRLLVADGAKLIEITNLSPASPPVAMPTAHFTHSSTDWKWTDAAEGPTAIYASGFSKDTSQIFKIGVTETAGVLDLDVPTVVLDMPRGENILSLFTYLGTYVFVGTTKGVRVAQIRQDGSLLLGPLLVDFDVPYGQPGWMPGFRVTGSGVRDAVAEGRYVYVGMGSGRAQMWRIDLGNPLEGELRFPVAADISGTNWDDYTFSTVAYPQTWGVTYAFNRVWWMVDRVGLHYVGSYPQASGSLETGRIQLGTLAQKAWVEATITKVPGSATMAVGDSVNLRVRTQADSGTWVTASGFVDTDDLETRDTGPILSGGNRLVSDGLAVQIQMTSPGYGNGVVLTGYQVSAIPAPTRSRLVSVPLQIWDWQKDRNGKVAGAEGYAWERLAALESLESTGGIVSYTDHTTGETASAYIERVTFTRLTPPFRGDQNAGGVAQVLLRLVP